MSFVEFIQHLGKITDLWLYDLIPIANMAPFLWEIALYICLGNNTSTEPYDVILLRQVIDISLEMKS